MRGNTAEKQHATLSRQLVLDELADLALYEALLPHARGELAGLLRALIPIERKHFEFWKEFFHLEISRLDASRRLRLTILVFLCRIFGAPAVGLVLEAIEVHGIKKYLRVWETYKDAPLGSAVRSVLEDEFAHEDSVVSETVTARVHPERIRDIFLGLNDGLVEMIGAISGFFAAFHTASAVLVAAFTVTVAGALSMAAGAFMGASSAQEMEGIEAGRRRFLGQAPESAEASRPFSSAASVGISYAVGALVPIAPVLFGAQNLFVSIGIAAVAVVVLSYILAFLAGMSTTRRIGLNLFISAIAVIVTYAIGVGMHNAFGIGG